MVIPSQIKNEYVKTARGTVAQTLQITVGENLELNRGDTIIVHPKKAGKVEIKRKEIKVPKDFAPYYATA